MKVSDDFLKAMNLMRRPDARLIQMNVRNKWEYWIAPSGVRVKPKIAEQIKSHQQVKGGADAMWPGLDQTWRIV
jgi:hypothetical protein